MSEPTKHERVTIESIRIERAPGIEESFALTGIGGGITVIHGPNGSGKSTTARSIHSLLWPEPVDDGCLIDATLTYNGYRWSIRRDGKSVRCDRDGAPFPRLSFPHLGPETRDRYHLALHDLLSADDEQFAAHVTREASGGFDLEEAAAKLQFHTAPSAPRSKTLRDLKAVYQQKLQTQAGLRQREITLTALETESGRAKQAGFAIIELNAIQQALETRGSLEEAREELARYDDDLANVSVTDAAAITDWRKLEPLLLQKLAELNQVIERETAQLAAIGLPSDVDIATRIRLLEETSEVLRDTEDDRRKNDVELETERTRLLKLHDAIAPSLPPSLHTEPAVKLLRAYGDALTHRDEADRISAAEVQLAEWVARPPARIDDERLYAGIRALTSWLQTPPPPEQDQSGTTLRLIALAAAVVVVVQGVLLGQALHPVAYAFVLVGIVFALFAMRIQQTPPPLDERPRYAADFLRLGLEEPDGWHEDAVAGRLLRLLGDYLSARANNLDADHWKTIAPRLAQRDRAIEAAEAKQQAIEATIGTAIPLDRHALTALARDLDDWVNASQDVAKLERRRELQLELERANLDAFNRDTGDLGIEESTNGGETRANLERLKERHAHAQHAQSAIEHAQIARDNQFLPALLRLEQGRQELIDRFSGRPIDEIDSLTTQFESYQQACERVRHRDDEFQLRCAYLDPTVDLTTWSMERVHEHVSTEREIEARATELNQKIGGIKTEIDLAKAGDDVADALMRVDAARDGLRERRDDHLTKLLGGLVLESVRRETREANLPDVAKRARAIFAQITHGRYELIFNAGPTPSFTASDTTTGRIHTLDQLSSATRVQLLIAVRTAFVETNEQNVCLPIIFDETLANADAARAEALIEATFELSRNGRQIFYFTAQQDEVQKWRQLAERHQMPIDVIDLSEARRLASGMTRTLIDLPPIEHTTFPPPNGHSRAAYRQLLGVPPLNLWSVDGGDVHLWHLIEDQHELHRLVAERKVQRWGQVRQLTVGDAAPSLDLDRDQLRRIAARADACIALIAALRIGRGVPVTRADLLRSGGLGGRFDDQCFELLDECGSDGRLFIECLENRRISNFRTEKTAAIKEFFEAHRHIVDEEPLASDDIRARVARQLNDDIVAGFIDLETISRLMADCFASDGTPSAGDEATQMVLSGKE